MNDVLVRATADLRRAIDASEVTTELLRFLDVVVAIATEPKQQRAEDVAEFIRETAPLIRKARVALGEYVSDLERQLGQEFYDDDWYRAAEKRSKIEYVRALYADHVDVDWTTFVDVENVDHMLRQRGNEEGPVKAARVPAGTPRSHWWWWYPGSPA